MTEQAPQPSAPQTQGPRGFQQAAEGQLYLPKGYETDVDPANSTLNEAMHIGIDEQGLGSVKYPKDVALTEKQEKTQRKEKNDKASDEILDPRNVIDLKAAIDHKVARKNDEESHLGSTKDGSKQAREAKTIDETKGSMIEDYLHIGDPDGQREIPKSVRRDLNKLLGKSYEELEDMIAERGSNNRGAGAGNGNGGEPGGNGNGNGNGNGGEDDPRVRIGKAIEQRMDELMDDGMSESDAHAQAHDEFWGKDPHIPAPPRRPGPPDPRPPRNPGTPGGNGVGGGRPGGNGGGGGRPGGNGGNGVPPVAPRTPDQRRPERIKGWKKAAAVGALALTAVGLFFGFGKEDKGLDFDIGNHGNDVHRVVEVDEAEDALRDAGVDEETRTAIAGNFDTAEQFFDSESGIATEQGQENFKNLEKAYEAKFQALKEEYGSTISESKLREFAKYEIDKGLAAIGADNARSELGGAK